MAVRNNQSCSECGAELRLGPARCPLCGGHDDEPLDAKAGSSASPDEYQATVRSLREQLRALREGGAEAV